MLMSLDGSSNVVQFPGQIDLPTSRKRSVVLRYLVTLRLVTVEVMLSIKLRHHVHLGIQRQGQLHGKQNRLHIQNRLRPGKATS